MDEDKACTTFIYGAEIPLQRSAIEHGFTSQICCAVPFDLILNLRRLKQLIKKGTVEEEREVIVKALRKSDMLEVSEDGQLIHNKDIKSEHIFTEMTSAVPPSWSQVLVSLPRLSHT